MSRADVEVIKMLLWLILRALSTNPSNEMIAAVCVGVHAIAAVFATFAEVDS